MLAALNIADEYYQLRRKYEGIEREQSRSTTHLRALDMALDVALDEALSDLRRTG